MDGELGSCPCHTPQLLHVALADVLLAPLAPELYQYQRQQRGRSVEEITAALTTWPGGAGQRRASGLTGGRGSARPVW
jgi:hypothetical protein